MSTIRVIPQAEGERLVSDAIRGSKPNPRYFESLGRRAEQVALRFCRDELTEKDKRHSFFAFNQPSVEAAVDYFANENERFQEMFLGDPPRFGIGCAEAECRGSNVLICRPNSPDVGELDSVSQLEGFDETREGCAQPPPFLQRTRAMYEKSDFRQHVRDAIFVKLAQFNNQLMQANANLSINVKPVLRRTQLGASPSSLQLDIAPLTTEQRERFLDLAEQQGYAMFFPNDFATRSAVLTENEATLLFLQTLREMPLVSPEGLDKFRFYGYPLVSRFSFTLSPQN